MKILFVHRYLPCQFVHILPALIARGHQCLALTSAGNQGPLSYPVLNYEFTPPPENPALHVGKTYIEMSERGAAVARFAAALRDGTGYRPDVIFGNSGFGETLFLKEVWPDAKLLIYPEWYYNGRGGEVDFDPEFATPTLESDIFLRAQSAYMGQAMLHADAALLPTHWQASVFPRIFRRMIEVCHDGIDTNLIRPNPAAFISQQSSGLMLRPGDEVLTFVNRNLEAMRGFHIFMRALPEVLEARPNARVVIVGNDAAGYGGPPQGGGTWKQKMLDEVGPRLDLDRVIFVGQVPHSIFINLLQVSRAHAYLTYPFFLSWSLLEAMAAGAPVIGSRTPPVEEVIEDGVTGRLVNFFDVPGWSAAMIDALANPEASRPMAEAARRRIVEKYDLSVCVPKWVDLVERHGRMAG